MKKITMKIDSLSSTAAAATTSPQPATYFALVESWSSALFTGLIAYRCGPNLCQQKERGRRRRRKGDSRKGNKTKKEGKTGRRKKNRPETAEHDAAG